MTRYLLTLIIGYLYATNVIGATYRDEECPECEYDDAKPIQVSNHVGYSGSVKLPKGSKSKSGTPKQTDSLPTPEQDEKNIEDDSLLWDQYVSKLYKKHDKGWKAPKGTKMPKHSKSSAQPDNTMIAYDNADDLSEEDSNLWDVYVSGRQSDNGNSDSNTPKRTKTPKAANPNSSTNAPTPFQDENVGSETPQDKDGESAVVAVFLPEFQLTFTLADRDTLRALRVEPVGHRRYLQSLLDIEIYNITYTYLLESASNPAPNSLYLRQSEATIGDESSSTIISTFQGMLTLKDYYNYMFQNETQTLLTNLFEVKKPLFLSKIKKSSLDALQRTEDVILSFTGKVSTSSSGFDKESWYQPNDETDEPSNENQKQDGDLNLSIVKSSDKTALIAGALAGSASLLLFAYAYRRRSRAEKEYAVTDLYGQEHENDLESRASQDEYQMSMVAPTQQRASTKLRDIALAGPKRNGFSYLEAVVSSSYSSGSSMSKLASGATQEEFARSGMKVDIYGSRKGHNKVSKKRVKKVAKLMGLNTPRRNNLSTDLDPIEEVNSAVSGSSVKTPESWQSGNKEINNAPPLLPARSVSSVPSDETPSNDLSNMNSDKKILETLTSSLNPDISYNTPLAVPPYDSMDMEGMKVYRVETPNAQIDELLSEETPLHMRCLSFGSASDISDFSSPEKSEESCLKDISGVINPVYSDSSSDGCAKDMLASINDCVSEDSKVENNAMSVICVDRGSSPVHKHSEIDLTNCSADTESLCYSQPSHDEDKPKVFVTRDLELDEMNCREQSQITAAFEELQARGDLFTKKLVNEKRRLSRLEAEIEDLDTEIARQREENKSLAVRVFNTHSIKASNDVTAQQRVDGVDPARLAEINQQKVVNNLEERLDKALTRKNTIESENIKIKEKIDNLRRKVVNDVAAKRDMEEKLDKIKYEIGEITKKHATASEKRDKIAEAQKQLIKDNEGEIKKFNEACASMNTYIQEQNELLEASIARVASDVVSKLEVIDSFHPRELDHSESPDDIDQLDRRLAELEHQLAQKKDPANPTEGAVKYDAESLKRLLETSGLHSTEDMIDFFMKEEDSLFSLFNYIQAVNQDCDRMLKEKAIVDRKMEQLEERMQRKETERKSFVDKYNRQLNEVRLDKERFKDQNEQRKTAVIHIARNIQELYDKLQCHNIDSKSPCILDQTPIQDQAIMSEDITSLEQQVSESNVLHQMEVIEQRAIQIIYEYAKKFDDQKNYRDARSLMQQKVVGSSLSITNSQASKESILASDDDYSDDDGSGNGRPVSIQDMRRVAADKLKKKYMSIPLKNKGHNLG